MGKVSGEAKEQQPTSKNNVKTPKHLGGAHNEKRLFGVNCL